MSLHSKIETKLSEALKAQDKKTYSTLRLIIAAIKDLMIAKKIKDKSTLPDNDLVALLKKMVKHEYAKIYQLHMILHYELKKIHSKIELELVLYMVE